MPTPTTLAALASPAPVPAAATDLSGVIARTCALARADWLAQLSPLAGLAAVGQRIHDIDADRAEQLARRNASNARVARWGLAARATSTRASLAPVDPAALAPFTGLAAAVAFIALLGHLAIAGQGYDVLHAAAHSCLHDQSQLVAGDPADIFEMLAARGIAPAAVSS